MKKTMAILCAAVLMLGLVACGTPGTPATTAPGTGAPATTAGTETDAPGGEVFKLGGFLPLSGPTAVYGQEARNAIELGVKQINEAGGLNGVPVQFICYDTTSTTEEAVKCATKLVEVDKVDACIMSVMSSEILASAGKLNEAGILSLGPATAASWIAEDWPFVFRAAMNNNDTIPMTVRAMQDLEYKTFAVFKGQDETALTTAAGLIKAATEAGMTLVAEESFDVGDNDFSGQIANIISKNPDCVYMSVNGEAGGVTVKQLRQFGYNGIIFNKESFMLAQAEVAGADASTYIAFSIPYITYKSPEDCDVPVLRTFLENYAAEYGKTAETDSSYRGYDAIMTIWEAAKIAGVNDSESLRQAMSKVKYEGLGGTLDFTAGTREGYKTFGSFILMNGSTNLSWDKWRSGGGYEAFLEATGRER